MINVAYEHWGFSYINMAWTINPIPFLLAFFLQAGLAQVPVPTNVTLQCHNMHNVLRWNYDQLKPGLKFKVHVGLQSGTPVDLWVDSPTLYIDLSDFCDPDNNYFVSVTAVTAANESDPSDPIMFSYFHDSWVPQKCTVDLPSVNVTLQEENVIHFRFLHPGLFYNADPKPRRKKSHELPEFEYDVKVVNQTKHSHRFYCKKKVCEEMKIPVDDGQGEYCVNIRGTMNKISVQPTQKYCTLSAEKKTPPNNNSLVFIIPLVVVAVIVLIVIMVCRKKTRPSSSIPEFLNFKGPKEKQLAAGGDREAICVPQVEPTSPTPLLSTPEPNESTLVDAPSIDSDLRLSIGLSTKESDTCDPAEVRQADVEEPGYKQGKDLDEDSSENLDCSDVHSGYERREALD